VAQAIVELEARHHIGVIYVLCLMFFRITQGANNSCWRKIAPRLLSEMRIAITPHPIQFMSGVE
jgi:hypothetical protein